MAIGALKAFKERKIRVPEDVSVVGFDDNGITYTFPAHSYTVIKFTVSSAAVTTPAIVGKVMNTAGSPLASVTVQVIGGTSVVTNSSGYYTMAIPGAGTYDLMATLAGYTTGHKYAVVADSGGTTPLPIILSP